MQEIAYSAIKCAPAVRWDASGLTTTAGLIDEHSLSPVYLWWYDIAKRQHVSLYSLGIHSVFTFCLERTPRLRLASFPRIYHEELVRASRHAALIRVSR